MRICEHCSAPLGPNGMVAECNRIGCEHDTKQFDMKVDAAKSVLTPTIVSRMSRNEMPECFEFTRESGVALAQLLNLALHQNQALIERLRAFGVDPLKPLH
jgi:hypothetical protein